MCVCVCVSTSVVFVGIDDDSNVLKLDLGVVKVDFGLIIDDARFSSLSGSALFSNNSRRAELKNGNKLHIYTKLDKASEVKKAK